MNCPIHSRGLTLLLAFVLLPAALNAESFRNPYRIPTHVDPHMIAVGDLNGDGIADFVWEDTSTNPSKMAVLLSQPGGGWLPGTSIS